MRALPAAAEDLALTHPSRTPAVFQSLLGELVTALDLSAAQAANLQVRGNDSLASCFPVSDLATAAIGVAGLAAGDLLAEGAPGLPVQVDRHLAAAWFKTSLRPLGLGIARRLGCDHRRLPYPRRLATVARQCAPSSGARPGRAGLWQ